MEFLNDFLPIIIYILLIILLVLLIIFICRLLKVTNMIKIMLDNIDSKIQSFNGIFEVINKFSNAFSSIGDKFIGFIGDVFNKLFRTKNEKIKEEDYNE